MLRSLIVRGVVDPVRRIFEPGDLDVLGIQMPADLGFEDPEHLQYVPTHLRFLVWMLRRQRIRSTDVFLDLGCGKGRAVYAAGRLRFARVIGIDLSPELVEAARGNLQRNEAHLRCRAWEVVVADVTTYVIEDDVTFVFLYDPFLGETFDAAVARIVESLERAPRRVRILYLNPVEHDRLVGSGRFRPVARRTWPLAKGDMERTFAVYDSA